MLNLMALSFLEPELWAIEFYVACIEFSTFLVTSKLIIITHLVF